jgi:hypothetical protein
MKIIMGMLKPDSGSVNVCGAREILATRVLSY